MNALVPLRRIAGAVDNWQRRTPWAGAAYGVVNKFGDDNANLVVVAMAWYGFTSIFPLLLVVVTLFGFIGQQSIGDGSPGPRQGRFPGLPPPPFAASGR